MKPTTAYLANFDSSAAMLRALANYLAGEDFPLLGAMPRWRAPHMKLLVSVVNALPHELKEQIYIWSGRFEAIAACVSPRFCGVRALLLRPHQEDQSTLSSSAALAAE
jgi:hypothetical protein